VTVAPEKTRILDAALLIGAGIVAACQVGKAFIAMPLIIVDLKIGVDVGSMILAVVALIGAIGAMPVSMVLRRLGAGRARIFGLVAIGIGSAIAADAPILIFSRAIEGLGLLATVLVISDLLQQTVAPRDRDLMLAIWGSYMPIGTVLMLLLGPALPEIGWRTLWAFNAILPIAYAALCFLRFGLGERGPLGTSPLSDIEALFQARAPLYLALAFGLYSFSYVAIAGFMPLILVTQLHLSVAAAGLFTTAAVAANVLGNYHGGRIAARRRPHLGKCRNEFHCVRHRVARHLRKRRGRRRDCNDGSNHARYRRSVTRLDLRRGAALRAQSATGFLAASRRHGHS
jgi:MFS family permease